MDISNPTFVGFYAAWLLVVWMVAFSLWTNYYLDIWAITSKRLVVVDQKRLFHRQTSSFRLERLQDMSVSFHGIIGTFLDFGTLEADTASGEDKFRATGLSHPRELKALVIGAADQTMSHGTKTGEQQDGLG
jgi:hypothetical protein